MPRLKLKRIASDVRAKLIETDVGGFVLGTNQDAKFDIYDPKQQQALEGIYKSEDFQIRNASYNPDVDSQFETDLNVQGPAGDYVSLVQGRNFAIAIKSETLSGIGNWNSLDNYYELEPELIPIYDKNDGTLDQTYFDNLSSPRILLSGLPYAYLSEIPLDIVSYDFDSGVMYADSISMKNPYDYKYDLDIQTIYPEPEFNETQILSGSLAGGNDFDSFGYQVSLDGNRALVAAYAEDPPGTTNGGVVYVLDFDGTSWNETQILSGSLVSDGDLFGNSISLKGDRALIGVSNEDPEISNNAGVAYVFDLSGSTWVESQILSGSLAGGNDNDWFGFSVSLDSNRVLIGAPREDPTALTNAGVAYVFDLSGSTWVESQILSGSLASNGTEFSGDEFGRSVALDNNRVIIGAYQEEAPGASFNSGVAYVFDLSGSTWVETQILTGSINSTLNKFGDSNSLSLDGDRIVVTADYEDTTGSNFRSGAAYVFDLSGSTWAETQVLTGSYASFNGRFGSSISLDNDRILIGASGEDPDTLIHTLTNAGVAYIFDLSGSTWVETQSIVGSLAPLSGEGALGSSVSLDGDRVLLGAPGEDPEGLNYAGVAYIHDFGVLSGVESSLLTNTREYSRIGVDKFDAWASYKPTKNYQTGTYSTTIPSETLIHITSESTSPSPFLQYEQIERIKGFNRLRGVQTKHKSNIYSIRIRNTNLNEAITDETLRNELHAAIESAIREVIPRIAPANTQLWKIEWQGL